MCVVILIAAAPWISSLAYVKTSLMVPIVLVLAILGCYLGQNAWENLVLIFFLGGFAYLLKRHDWPRAPFVIGVILGKIAEDSLLKALAILRLRLLHAPDFARADRHDHRAASASTSGRSRSREGGDRPWLRDASSSPGMMLLIFAAMVGVALTFPGEARFLPLVIGIPGLALHGSVRDRAARQGPGREGFTAEDRMAELKMFGWFAVFIFGIILFGFPYAGPVIVVLYLHFSWGEKWYVSLGAAAFSWAVLHGIFDYVLGLPLFEGLVYQWIYG